MARPYILRAGPYKTNRHQKAFVKQGYSEPGSGEGIVSWQILEKGNRERAW